MIDVEICTPSRLSAVAAKEGGAKRIELCSNLEVGGLTPTDEDIVYCVQTLGLRTHVLVRPRAGNFLYSADEMAEIERTVMRCRQLGAAAVVVGFLTPDGKVDLGLTRRIRSPARPHRGPTSRHGSRMPPPAHLGPGTHRTAGRRCHQATR